MHCPIERDSEGIDNNPLTKSTSSGALCPELAEKAKRAAKAKKINLSIAKIGKPSENDCDIWQLSANALHFGRPQLQFAKLQTLQ